MLRAASIFMLLIGGASALTLNQPAPDFTLEDSAGRPWPLAAHLGRERLLVVSRPSGSALDEYARQAAVLKDRDVRVVALLPPGDAALNRPSTPTLTLLADPGGKVAARYGRAALIGKDRGVKAVYPAPPSLSDVLELVDQMPMRQQERLNRGK
jgi:peroxiredoxin